jgi:hypothetical protein
MLKGCIPEHALAIFMEETSVSFVHFLSSREIQMSWIAARFWLANVQLFKC